MLAMENSSKSLVWPYTSCTGQLWYVHWFPSSKVCLGPNSRTVQLWEVFELEFDFIDCGHLFIYLRRVFQRDLCGRTGAVQVKSGMHIDYHLQRCVMVQTAELYSPGKYLNWNLNFFQLRACVSYGEFFKVPCTAVQGLCRSSLVCTLIPILKGVFWS